MALGYQDTGEWWKRRRGSNPHLKETELNETTRNEDVSDIYAISRISYVKMEATGPKVPVVVRYDERNRPVGYCFGASIWRRTKAQAWQDFSRVARASNGLE
jgi:hypothetical protein